MLRDVTLILLLAIAILSAAVALGGRDKVITYDGSLAARAWSAS